MYGQDRKKEGMQNESADYRKNPMQNDAGSQSGVRKQDGCDNPSQQVRPQGASEWKQQGASQQNTAARHVGLRFADDADDAGCGRHRKTARYGRYGQDRRTEEAEHARRLVLGASGSGSRRPFGAVFFVPAADGRPCGCCGAADRTIARGRRRHCGIYFVRCRMSHIPRGADETGICTGSVRGADGDEMFN